MSRGPRIQAVVVAGALAFRLAAPGVAGAEQDPILAEGFDLAYNLDHEAAVETFERAIAERPDDPVVYRSVAAATWLHILFLRGAILVDNYLSGSVNRRSGKAEKPPEKLARVFEAQVERAIALSEEAVRRSPEDATAQYDLGAAVALAASYRASIGGESLRALRDAKRAYEAHERALELDPGRHDAKLLLGIYRYVVSILPRAFRMMAYLVGFDGGKDEAIQMVAEAAAYPSAAQTEAQFALVLLYNREREYGKAQRVLSELKRRYPRNRLVWLESASTWLRDDRPAMAELALAHGFAKLQADDRRRMVNEDAVWHLKRGTARVSLGLTDEAASDLRRAADAAGQMWVAGRAHLELGKIADLAGDRVRARDEYDRSRDLCEETRDRACEAAADTLRNRPYTGR